ARPAPAPVARRQAAASAAASASCATARRRERLLRKSRAAANDQESKVRAREIRASGAGTSAGRRSVPLPPRRPSGLQPQSAVRLPALRLRARAALPPRGRDHNHHDQPEQRREVVARHRAAAAGAKSSGNRPAYALSRRSLQCSTAGGRIAAAEAASARGERQDAPAFAYL